MPAPVVYVGVFFGVVAAVSAGYVFKQFVYDPIIHPHVLQFVEEVQESHRRRREQRRARPHAAQHPLHSSDLEDDDEANPLVTPPASGSGFLHKRNELRNQEGDVMLRRRRAAGPPTGPDSDEERYGPPHSPRGPASTGSVSRGKKAGNNIELDELAPEVREWSRSTLMAGTAGAKRPTSPLDETNHTIPFATLQPSRTSSSSNETPRNPLHKVATSPHHQAATPPMESPASTYTANSTPTGTPSMHRRMQDLPRTPETHHQQQQQQQEQPQFESVQSILFSTNDHGPHDDEPPTPVVERRPTSPTHTDLSSLITSPPLVSTFPLSYHHGGGGAATSPRPSLASSFALSDAESGTSAVFQTPRTDVDASLPGTPPPAASTRVSGFQIQANTSGTPRTDTPELQHNVPSLSQIYHQDHLDYEHGLVLLSPPSSRSESPFSVVSQTASPRFSGMGVPSSRASSALSDYRSLANSNSNTTSPTLSATGNTSPGQNTSHPHSHAHPQSQFSPRAGVLRTHARTHSAESGASDMGFDFIPSSPTYSSSSALSVLSSPNPSSSTAHTPAMSAFDSPSLGGVSSPFALSPFASPRMGSAGQQRVLSMGARERPVSPALSEASVSVSDLDVIEREEVHGFVVGGGAAQDSLR